jgi:hypothetical protein
MSFDLPTWVVPYSLWSGHGAPANWPANDDLPFLRQWMRYMQRISTIHEATYGLLPTSLAMPHEVAQAQAFGLDVENGCVPWAAIAASQQHLSASQSAWAFVSLCNWHVSNGQVTMGDPAHLQIDADTDAQLFEAMQDFFAQDGIALYPFARGQWLAQSEVFAGLPTASLDRVIGRNIDPWLVGGAKPTGSATMLRRLQNEMQMLLYTHPVNANRSLAINSLWWHGAGALPSNLKENAVSAKPRSGSPAWTDASQSQVQAIEDLRYATLQQDWQAWTQAWKRLDQTLFADLLQHAQKGEAMHVVLCGEEVRHTYATRPASIWSRLQSMAKRLGGASLHTCLVVPSRSEDI